MGVLVGVDSSTQSTKVELRDADSGALVSSGRAAHPATHPPRSEQDPAAWWAAFEAAYGAAARDGGAARAGAVAAIAVAGQQHGMVVLDAAGDVIRPAKLWNDTESAADASWLIHRLGGPAAWAAACGSVPVAAFTITKLSWLHRREPDAFARIASVLLPHDWLTYRLSGVRVTDRGDASGTGYWSPADDRWRPDLLAIVDAERDWSRALPEVLGPVARAGEWRGAVVAPGTGDNMAAALGLGLRPGDVVLSFGTSGTAFTVADRPACDPTGTVAGFADASGRFLPLVCTLNATKVTDAFAALLGVDQHAFSSLALAAPAGAEGVVLVPHLDGERTPNLPEATGTLWGLRSGTSRAAIARAAVEGVVCNLLEGLDRLGVPDPARVFLIGGGSRSPAYQRVVADLLGREVIVPVADEHVAAGACVQAAAVLHGTEPSEIAAAWGLASGAVVEPGAVDRDAVRAAFRAAADASVAR